MLGCAEGESFGANSRLQKIRINLSSSFWWLWIPGLHFVAPGMTGRFFLLEIAEQRRKITVRSSEDCLRRLKIEYLQKASSAAAVTFRVAQGIGAADDGLENVSFGSVFFASKKMNLPNRAKRLSARAA